MQAMDHPAPAGAPVPPPSPRRAHDDEELHFHDGDEAFKAEVASALWQAENVELTTVGMDIGSSTSHLMFARVHLQRKAQMLSSEFVVVDREVLWRSPILLTPFLPDDTIDAGRLRRFVDQCYLEAELPRARVDSGAVILTGEAIKRRNAQAIAEIFASDAGRFVCASAGHHLECVLSAHGGGAVELSRRTHRTILNVDIGGGTTKFALIERGEIRSTCAVAAGGRLVAYDASGRLARIEGPARQAARALGIELRPGEKPDPQAMERLVETLSEIVLGIARQQAPAGLALELLLTEPLAAEPRPHWICFTGGVSEYIYGREAAEFGDIARPLARRMAAAFSPTSRPELIDPGQGIRATVIGAAQFSVQVSGTTIHLSSRSALPVRNVPVVFPELARQGDFDGGAVAAAVRSALERIDAEPGQPVALGIRWHGDPHHRRMHALAQGIAGAAGGAGASPLILMVDGDIGRLLGHILEEELRLARPVVSIDGVRLRELDYVDIGEPMPVTGAVPVVIKSLLFPGSAAQPRRRDDHHHH